MQMHMNIFLDRANFFTCKDNHALWTDKYQQKGSNEADALQNIPFLTPNFQTSMFKLFCNLIIGNQLYIEHFSVMYI